MSDKSYYDLEPELKVPFITKFARGVASVLWFPTLIISIFFIGSEIIQWVNHMFLT